jgi:hemin uptake protein HemP
MDDRDVFGTQGRVLDHASARLTTPPADERSVSSLQLFKGGRELIIEHDGARYRLRITRQEKLILTK